MQIGRKVDPNKRKTKEDSSDTSMEAPPKKAANMELKKKKEEKIKDSTKVATIEVKENKEEDNVTVSKEHMKEMQTRFDQRLNENIELKKRVAEWSNQIEAMSNRVQQAESSKQEMAKKLYEVEKLLNTPILGVATPIAIDGQRISVFDCALCAEKGMNQNEPYTHLRQIHNVLRGEFDRIPVEEGDEREIVSADTENVDIILQVRPVAAPRRRGRPGEPAAAGEGQGGGGEGQGEAAGVGRAPRTTAQTAEYRQEFPGEQQSPGDREHMEDGEGMEDREQQQGQQEFNCEECSFQTSDERRLGKHTKEVHRIICFTCQDTFRSFSKMIDHRRVTHPSNKKCNKFPACDKGDRCLYKHEGNKEAFETQAYQAHEGRKITCRSCQQDFNDKDEMMMHRKNEHLSYVKSCKNIQAGISCQKGPVYCWYRHDLPVLTTRGNSRSTWGPITTAPAFNVENFPYGPTPQRAMVGQDKAELQMIYQTLQQQQQQMVAMMAEIMRMKK